MKFFIAGTINPKCNCVFLCVNGKRTDQPIPKDRFGNLEKANDVSAECLLTKCCSLKIEDYSISDIKQS